MKPRKGKRAMKTETLKGDIETVFGKKLDTKLTYEGPVELFETKDEVVAANELPTDDEVIAFRNTQRRNNRRQKLMADAIDAAAKEFTAKNGETVANPFLKPTLESSADMRYKNIYDALIAAKKTPEEADRIARVSLGMPLEPALTVQ